MTGESQQQSKPSGIRRSQFGRQRGLPQSIEHEPADTQSECDPSYFVRNVVLLDEEGGEDDPCCYEQHYQGCHIRGAAWFYPAVAVPRVEADCGDRSMQGRKAIERGVASPDPINLASPKVSHQGLGKEFLAPPVCGDGEDDVDCQGDGVDGDQRPTQGVPLPILHQTKEEHSQDGQWVKKVNIEDHELRDEWDRVIQPPRQKVQAVTGAWRVELPGPFIPQGIKQDIEEQEKEDDIDEGVGYVNACPGGPATEEDPLDGPSQSVMQFQVASPGGNGLTSIC